MFQKMLQQKCNEKSKFKYMKVYLVSLLDEFDNENAIESLLKWRENSCS